MKDKYLDDLRRRLEEYDIDANEIEDILNDYSEMIDDAMSKNMSEEEIYNLIGTPRKVVQDLREQFIGSEDMIVMENENGHHHHHHHHRHHDNKIVALMPFVTVILFFILGMAWGLWHPGWLVFLLIPITAIIVNVFDDGLMTGLVSLSPFIATIVYLGVGFIWNIWHPTWLVFLIIPILGIFTGAKRMNFLELLTALSPFIAGIAFVLIWYFTGSWQPVFWLVFLLIPVIGILNEKVFWKLLVMEGTLLLAIAAYMFIGYQYGQWGVSAFIFLIPLGVAMLVSDDAHFNIEFGHGYLGWLSLTFIVLYIVFGFLFNSWAYLWMIFLLIPVLGILRNVHDKNKLTAIMPFVATAIFFSLGYFFGFWAFSWIAFLLIPMTAIIKNA